MLLLILNIEPSNGCLSMYTYVCLWHSVLSFGTHARRYIIARKQFKWIFQTLIIFYNDGFQDSNEVKLCALSNSLYISLNRSAFALLHPTNKQIRKNPMNKFNVWVSAFQLQSKLSRVHVMLRRVNCQGANCVVHIALQMAEMQTKMTMTPCTHTFTFTDTLEFEMHGKFPRN